MPLYQYVARDAGGEVTESSLSADSRFDALSLLRSQGLTVIELHGSGAWEEQPENAGTRRKRRTRSLWRARIGLTEKALFCRQIAISVTSGVPLRETIASITEDMTNPPFKEVLTGVLARLHDGHSFSEALAGYQKVFGRLFVSLMRSAEEAGSMPETLEHLSESLERSDRLARKVRTIASYPIFVMGIFVLICLIMTLFVLPKLRESFATLHSDLPALTQAVFGVNEFIVDHFWLFAAGAAGLFALYVIYKRTPTGRRQLDQMKLRVPFFGECLRKLALARICRNLAIMLRGGVPVTTAIEITSEVCGNQVLENALLDARDRIVQGNDIASSLGYSGTFPSLVVRMVHVGETSGRLPQVLEKVSDTYEDQAEGAIMVATSMLEPVMICVFGAIVLALVLAIYMPALSIGSRVGAAG